jgi:cysteine desulfurase
MTLPVYLDCNATTPMEPAVAALVRDFFDREFGNEGSRTHVYGAAAKQAVQRAREQVASVVGAKREEVIFTSGATESNNLAILGLAPFGSKSGRRHIVSTAIEHKAVLEPLEHLGAQDFEVTLIECGRSGAVSAEDVLAAVREDTLLVSVMHVNNETGIQQPIGEICSGLAGHAAYLHVDAAQSFGKDLAVLKNTRIDLISASGHKLYAPKGVGALVTRRREYDRPPIEPLFFGGGQERGLRPGTLPVGLIAGLGLACELAVKQAEERAAKNSAFRSNLLEHLAVLGPIFHGDHDLAVPHTINFSIPGVDSEALMVALKDLVAVSNGSACTSSSYSPSHVLTAMDLTEDQIAGAVRMSWCHMTPEVDWGRFVEVVQSLR